MTFRRAVRSALVALTLALVLPMTAYAQDTAAPPGNSAVDEYVETLPSVTGPKHRGSKPRRGAASKPSAVDAATAEALQAAGGDGAAALAAADDGQTTDRAADSSKAVKPGATRGGKSASPSSTQGSGPVVEAAEAGPPSAPAALIRAATGGDGQGMGVVLPSVLAATILAAGGVLLTRWRRSS